MRLFRQRSRSATVGRHFQNLAIRHKRQKQTIYNEREERILQILSYLADTKMFVI